MLGVDYTTTQEIVPALCYATTSLVPPSPAQHPPPIPSVLRTLRVGTRFARSWFTYLGVDPKPTIQRTKWIVWRCPARHQCCSQCGVEILQGPRGVLLRAATNRPSTRGHGASFHARYRTSRGIAHCRCVNYHAQHPPCRSAFAQPMADVVKNLIL